MQEYFKNTLIIEDKLNSQGSKKLNIPSLDHTNY